MGSKAEQRGQKTYTMSELERITIEITQSEQHVKKQPRQPRQHVEKQKHYFTNKGLSSQGYGFSSGHV